LRHSFKYRERIPGSPVWGKRAASGSGIIAVDFGGNPPYQWRLAEAFCPSVRNTDAEDAVRLYRRLLASEEGRLEIIEIGYPQVIADLLKSGADDISAKSGLELVAEKVSKFWVMAGKWDADGEKEEISKLESGSGYLSLDKNGDGIINDGSELFGPKSGNGFGDLAAYDEDANGWIDENDEIWSKLKIWCKDEKGNDKLYTLAESGVGAICLQNAETNFTQGNAENVKGYIRKTGIFLYENGNVGTLQHLDLAQ